MSQLEKGDMRLTMPRFRGDNLTHNLKLAEEFTAIAIDNNCTPAQLALAWLLSKDPDIPGTKRVGYRIYVSDYELEKAREIFNSEAVRGERYHPS